MKQGERYFFFGTIYLLKIHGKNSYHQYIVTCISWYSMVQFMGLESKSLLAPVYILPWYKMGNINFCKSEKALTILGNSFGIL